MAFSFTITLADLQANHCDPKHLANATPTQIAVWTAMADPLVDEEAWGDLAQTAVELLVIHFAHEQHKGMEQGSQVGAQTSQTMGAGLTNAWSGPVGDDFDRIMSSTIWGQQFVILRKSRASTAALFA